MDYRYSEYITWLPTWQTSDNSKLGATLRDFTAEYFKLSSHCSPGKTEKLSQSEGDKKDLKMTRCNSEHSEDSETWVVWELVGSEVAMLISC